MKECNTRNQNEFLLKTLKKYSGSNIIVYAPTIKRVEETVDFLAERNAIFKERRDLAAKIFNSIPGISCRVPEGAFYLFPNISGTGLKSTEFCAKLLETEKVAAVPGIAFGADDYIRLSYATSMANIEKGLDRLDKFCRTLVK